MATPINASTLTMSDTKVATTSKSILGKDDFMKLLITQLRYQDPLNPMSGTEFAAQLAQFSSVEQLHNISEQLTMNLDASNLMTQSISNALAATMVGKDIKASGETFAYAGTGEARFGYTLPGAAESVVIKIQNEAGVVVKSIKGTGLSKGDTTVTWDGLDEDGNRVAAGSYTFTVEAKDVSGNTIEARPYLFGRVTSVRFKATGTVFVLDGVEIPLADVLEIL
jgi:flagellar basal-body rod modification protein FlgD